MNLVVDLGQSGARIKIGDQITALNIPKTAAFTVLETLERIFKEVPSQDFETVYLSLTGLYGIVTEEQAIRNFYLQILTGDKVDNIIGLAGIGPVKSKKLLVDCNTELEMYEAVLKAYDGDEARVLENARLLWILREEKQVWQPPVK